MIHLDHYQILFHQNSIILLVLSGPNLAKEIADEKIAGTVIASPDESLINIVKSVCHLKLLKYIQVKICKELKWLAL